MALYGNVASALASVAANSNVVTITGLDLTLVTPGMTINLGARDRKTGDAWVISAVAPNGANGGTVTTQANIPTAYTNAPFLIDTTGYLSTDASYAAVVGLTILTALQTLLGVGTNLYSGARQIALDKASASVLSRLSFSTAGRAWGDIVHRTFAYTPTGGAAASIETLALRAFPDGSTPTDALLLDLTSGTGDLRQATATMVSAATVDLGSAPAGKVAITGAAGISSFGPGRNLVRLVRFVDGGATLVHTAASLFLPGGANILTRAGDTLIATSDAAGNWRVHAYQRADAPPVNTSNLVPPGAAGFFWGSVAPSGWLKANGAAVSRTAYAALFAAIGTTYGAGDGSTTFNLPDARGEFLRGFDDGRGVDPGRAFGSFQGQALANHYHRTAIGFQSGVGFYGWINSENQPIFGFDVIGSAGFATVPSQFSGGTYNVALTEAVAGGVTGENRPRNLAPLACIKF